MGFKIQPNGNLSFSGKNNQFVFSDSTQLFCSQHDARIMSGINHISIFDNGNCHDPLYSSAAEYEIDHDHMTGTLISRLRGEPDIISSFLGNAQRVSRQVFLTGKASLESGINEDEFYSSFRVFPNPVSDYLNIESNWERIVSVEIMNNMGQIMNTMSTAPSKRCKILLDEIPGIYFIKITTENEEIRIGRVIKN